MFKKVLLCAITVFFSLQYIVGAVPIYIENAPIISKEIFIPESYGVIERSSFDKYLSTRFVILLKDAHCNYDAQHNIARILEVLVRDYKIDLVAIEGAVGLLDFTRFWELENGYAKEKMADDLVKRGILTGPEYLSIIKHDKISFNIYGIEDEDLYIENFKTFRNTINHLEETKLFISELNRIVGSLKGRIYPKELLEFDNKSTQYCENAISLTDWVNELNKEAEKQKMALKGYPNILLTLDAISLEDKIDFKMVEIERAEALRNLQKTLSKEELKEMIRKSLQFRLGKIASKDYYQYLEKLLNPMGVSSNEKFSNLIKYIELVKLQSWINNDALFSEVSNLEDNIKETMFQNNIQRQLDDISKKARILNGLFNLTLTRENIEYYRTHKVEFMPASLLSFINIQAPAHNLPISMLLNDKGFLEKVSSIIEDGEKFYNLAVKRDVKLVENALRVMEEEKKSSAVMVIGGFHTDGVEKLFEQKGVGYVIISPKIIKAEKEGLYISLMMDNRIQLGSTLAYPKLVADGEDNVRLIANLGAKGLSDAYMDLAMQLYYGYLRRVFERIPEGAQLPFSINEEGGKLIVNINPDFSAGDIQRMLIEWFRMGLAEVLNANPELRNFITTPDNFRDYINRTTLVEYASSTGDTRQEGILRRATLGFITFYLGICKVYQEKGFLGIPEEIRRREFLPDNIEVKELGLGYKWPKIRDDLLEYLKGKAETLGVDELTLEWYVNYLFTMLAYEKDTAGKIWQTTFFKSFLGLFSDRFKVDADEELKGLLDNVRDYRFLQVYSKEGQKPVEQKWRRALDKVKTRYEKTVEDSLKRRASVGSLTRIGLDDMTVWDGYKKFESNFDEGLPTVGNVENTIFVSAISMYLGDLKVDRARGEYQFRDISILTQKFLEDIQVSVNNYQYFLYETEDEREAFKLRLGEYKITVDDKQFLSVKDYNDRYRGGEIINNKTGSRDRVVVMVTNAQKGEIAEANEGDIILTGNEGGNDPLLMIRLAIGVKSLVLTKQIRGETLGIRDLKDTVRDLYRKYYLGTYSDSQIDSFLENISFENGIIRIILPPIAPIMREYLDFLQHERQTLRFA